MDKRSIAYPQAVPFGRLFVGGMSMSDAAKRLREEIQRNTLRRMSYIGQAMTQQEYAMVNFLETLENTAKKPKSKRSSTLEMEQKIIAEYEKQLKRKRKDYRGALHRDEVPKVRVTAREIFDAIGDKIGVKIPRIRQVLREYKKSKT